MTRVLVVDDHPLWRDAVARDLDDAGHTVVGTAGDGDQALRVATATTPDLVLLDLQLPGRSGVDVTRAMCSGPPPPYVLVALGQRRAGRRARRDEGRRHRLPHQVGHPRGAARRRRPGGARRAGLHAGLAGLVLGEFRQLASGAPAHDVLTPRETEVLRLVATGRSYRQIAEQLVVSHRTVQNHVQNILGKLHLNNRVQLTRYAIEHGLGDG